MIKISLFFSIKPLTLSLSFFDTGFVKSDPEIHNKLTGENITLTCLYMSTGNVSVSWTKVNIMNGMYMSNAFSRPIIVHMCSACLLCIIKEFNTLHQV